MPDIDGILKSLNALLELIFGKNVPGWIAPVTGWTLLTVFLLSGLWGFLVLLSKIRGVWTKDFLPLFYDAELKRCRHRRRQFAEHIGYEIRRLDLQEDWRDDRFAELEAEVEADGRRKHSLLFPFGRQRNGLRRERSLSKAIAYSQERCIIVEGDPGSGKSVALRHVAMQLASKAKRARNVDSIIPIYVNLKELECPPDAAIDRNLIEEFILKSLRRVNDRDVDAFLDDEFANGIKQGTWFFLFDSFDELPAVLSSTEADNIIRQYGDAIADFLEGGMNPCRGVIASRQFRGPKHFSWPRFRILALSEERRRELIHKVDLKPKLELEVIGRLGTASDEIRSWASNPLFLALLCEHMRSGNPFPENVHVVFEAYIEHRLKRDQERLNKRFSLDITEIRVTAENIAFCMAANQGLGLSPTRAKLTAAMTRQGINIPAQLDTLLDALEYMKLARSDSTAAISDERVFTFAHRRFQEYFATSVVLRDPSHVPPLQLLTDGRWRETAVVMCQTQPIHVIDPLLAQAEQLLISYGRSIPNRITNSTRYVQQKTPKLPRHTVERFPWPANALYLLELLQNGLAGRLHEIPAKIRMWVGQIGLTATVTGTLGDRKSALEVSGIAPEPVFHYMLQSAFSEQSQWLKEVAYRQVARPQIIKPEVEQSIRLAIVAMNWEGRLKRERYSTQTHVARLPQPAANNLLSIVQLLLVLPLINLMWHAFLLLYFAVLLLTSTFSSEKLIVAVAVTFLSFIFSRSRYSFLRGVDFGVVQLTLAYFFLFSLISSVFFIYTNLFVNQQMNIIRLLLMFQCFSTLNLSIYLTKYVHRVRLLLYMFIPFYPVLMLFRIMLVYFITGLKRVGLRGVKNVIWSFVLLCFAIAAIGLIGFLILSFASLVGPFANSLLFVSIVYTIFMAFIVWYLYSRFCAGKINFSVLSESIKRMRKRTLKGIRKMWKICLERVEQNRRRRKAWRQLRQQPMTYQNLFSLVSTFRTDMLKLFKIIDYVRKHQSLIPCWEAEEKVRELALEVEREAYAKEHTSSREKLYVDYDTCILLDELYLLIDDMHAKLPPEDGL